jgi:four helix bundle protein
MTASFPNTEIYGLVSQIRRAAVSVSSNIVEGKSRDTSNEFRRFLIIARGSLEELKYQMYLSKDLNFLNEKNYDEFIK